MRRTKTIRRTVSLAAIAVAVVVLAIVLFGSGSSYTVHARFENASQLVKGDQVQVSGRPVGTIKNIDLTEGGEADVTMDISDDGYKPLRQGTQAVVRQASLSGVANRYVDLRLPDGRHNKKIPDGGLIPQTSTTTAVDLDQLFNTFDPKTRNGLRDVIRGFATAYGGRGNEANKGWLYLNPALATSSRLFGELNADTPLFERFVVASSKLVTDLADRHDQLAGVVDNLATTTGAIGRQKAALADAVSQLPAFMRRANTTFVNLRATLDDLTPLVDESKPVAKKLRPFLSELRPLARDARPTLADLSRLIRQTGPNNDLIELTKSTVPLRDIAIGPVQANGQQREGAFPASTKALAAAAPELATARPYAPDLTGWFDDFSHSGIYDALGGASRAAVHINAFSQVNGLLQPLPANLRDALFRSVASLGQRDRCPGSVERGSVYKPTPDFPCDATQVPEGK